MPDAYYEVGRYYEVPCVRARWCHWKPAWVPVLGPWHNDEKLLAFKPDHYHPDLRFVSDAMLARASGSPAAPRSGSPQAYPIVVEQIMPTTQPDPASRNDFMYGYVHKHPDLVKLPPRDETWFRIRRMKCKRASLGFPAHLPAAMIWQARLCEAYADAKLKPGRVCPHRGADLSTIPPDENGVVQCPLHGLFWNVETGRLSIDDAPVDLPTN